MADVPPALAVVVWSVLGLASALAGALAAYALVWLKDKRRLTKHEYARGVLVRLTEAAITAVKVTQQKTVDDLKADLAGGKLTAERARQIADEALDRALRYLADNGRREAERIFGPAQVEDILRAKIEAAVQDSKPPRLQLGLGVPPSPAAEP